MHTFGKIESPENIAKIGLRAFSSCHSLKEIIIPKNIKVIESGVFKAYFMLERVYTPEESSKKLLEEHEMFGKSDNDLDEPTKMLKELFLSEGREVEVRSFDYIFERNTQLIFC